MLIVTGANGTFGSLVVERLLARVPASQLGISVREPARAAQFAERGVRVRQGDFDDLASLAHAFEGVSDILIISAAAVGEVALRRHRNAIDAAKAAGARRIVYTSHMGARVDSAFPPMRSHAASEELLEASGVPFVSLRNGFYASTVLRYLAPGSPERESISAKLGELAAPLTAGVVHDMTDIARIASEVTGKRIERVVVSDDELRASMEAQQLPELAITMTLGLFQAARRGDFAATDPQLEALIGRPPQTVRDVVPR